MDLINKLLKRLSSFNPMLHTLAQLREQFHAMPDSDRGTREIADLCCKEYLSLILDQIVPAETDVQQEVLESMPRREEVITTLKSMGYSMTFGSLMGHLITWAGAQGFTGWGQVPWKVFLEVVFEEAAQISTDNTAIEE